VKKEAAVAKVVEVGAATAEVEAVTEADVAVVEDATKESAPQGTV
jgi:hypothetical protein